jgi:hypothetical protein
MPLLVSGDGYLDRLEVSHGVEDEHGIIHIPARIKLPEAQWGDFAEEGLRPHMQKLQWSTASGKARWAFDVEAIHHDGTGDVWASTLPRVKQCLRDTACHRVHIFCLQDI